MGTDSSGPVWDELAETRGGRHFGRWWVSQKCELTEEGAAIGLQFYGYQPNGSDLVIVDSLEDARAFYAQLGEAIDYAERELSGVPALPPRNG